jgi:hypothetical protein
LGGMLEYALISDVYKVDTLPAVRARHKTACKSGERQQDDMSRQRLESSPIPQPVAVPVADERREGQEPLHPYEGPMYHDAKGRYPVRFMERRPVVYETFAADPDGYGVGGFEGYVPDHECRCRTCDRRMRGRRRRTRSAYDVEGLMRNVLFSFVVGAFAIYLIDILRSRR